MNDLIKLNVPIQIGTDDAIHSQIATLTKCMTCYSFVVRTVFEDDVLRGWTIQVNVSAKDKYNTITAADLMSQVYEIIHSNIDSTANVIGYGQAPADILVEAAEPLTRSLARKAYNAWSRFGTYDDFADICRTVVFVLYMKGRYVSQDLIKREFWNQVYKYVGREKKHKEVSSLDEVDEDGTVVYETVPDIKEANARSDKEDEQYESQLLIKLKDAVVEYIGQRQYDQLLFEYQHKTTTSWARKKMQSIKAYLFDRGIINTIYRELG